MAKITIENIDPAMIKAIMHVLIADQANRESEVMADAADKIRYMAPGEKRIFKLDPKILSIEVEG